MRMKKHQRLPVIVGAVAILLIVIYFAVVRPLSESPPDTPPAVTTGQGEGVHYNKGTLYPHVPRQNMLSITVHNEKGTYRFSRVADEGKQPTATDRFVILQEKKDGWTVYPHIRYDEERFSEIVVATGTFYYLRNLGEEPELEGKKPIWSDYGLAPEDDPAWFELETLDGIKYKVYVGDPAVTDGGYYVRVEVGGIPRDTVYVSNSNLVGETALASLPSFVDATLTSTPVSNAFYYNKDVTLWRTAPEGYVLTKDDTVSYRYRTTVDGVTSEPRQGSTDMRTARSEVLDAFLGRRIGDTPLSFTITYAADESFDDVTDEEEKKRLEALRGKTVTYSVEEIVRIEELYIELNFLNADDRSEFHAFVAYMITGPSTKTGYLPNSQNFMGILETFGQLVGSETVAVGLDLDIIEELGLNAYCYYYETPVKIQSTGSGAGNVKVDQYLPNYLYISEKREDEKGAYYYVGSVLTDVVARVDAAELAFLEKPNSWWLESAMYSVVLGNIAKMEFDFDYTDADETYTFLIESQPGKNQFRTVTGVSWVEGGRSVVLDAYKDLYAHLSSTSYEGEYDGTLPKDEVMAGQPVLTLTLTMNGGDVYSYRFYPYSARHVLVSVTGDENTEGAFFYVLSSDAEKIYRDLLLVLEGKRPDPGKQY